MYRETPMNRWQVGDVTITRIVEMEVAGGSRFILPDATPQACLALDWLQPHFMNAEGQLIMSVHALVVDTGRRRIVVDTCIGNDKERSIPNWSHLQTSFLADLEQAGYPRHSIDTVLCTHLHVDHVGWNTMLVDGRWVPTFPNARYLLADREWQYWSEAAADSLNVGVLDDSVRPVFEAGLVDLIDWEHQVCEEVRLQPTPGHTPGHVSVHIRSNGEEALITGDSLHHPCQMTRTDWCSSADFDAVQGRRTREALLARYADRPVLVIGTHFATPTAGHVKTREQGGYWLDVG
jgi:glyoxylase-like metal-dependent hydrolase (beta-lactamase superfamily II)